MKSLYPALKTMLPPSVSFKLRSIKSQITDSDFQAFRKLVSIVSDRAGSAIDVGANFGLYSAMMSQSFRKIISVEPNPTCVHYMRSVLPANCAIFQCAISDCEGQAALRIPLINGREETTRATIADNNHFGAVQPPVSEALQVQTRTIDSLIAETAIESRIALLKIDTEGHELASWTGAQRTISLHQPSLCIEIERQHGDESMRLLQEIKERGYIGVLIDKGRLVADARFDEERLSEILDDVTTANRYFVHRERKSPFGL